MNLDQFDKIHIRHLASRCILGVYEEERNVLRDVILNLTIFFDKSSASTTDNVADAIDYAHLADKVTHAVKLSSFCLIESLAEKIANCILSDTRIRACRVILEKPGVPKQAESTAVEILRHAAYHLPSKN